MFLINYTYKSCVNKHYIIIKQHIFIVHLLYLLLFFIVMFVFSVIYTIHIITINFK